MTVREKKQNKNNIFIQAAVIRIRTGIRSEMLIVHDTPKLAFSEKLYLHETIIYHRRQ